MSRAAGTLAGGAACARGWDAGSELEMPATGAASCARTSPVTGSVPDPDAVGRAGNGGAACAATAGCAPPERGCAATCSAAAARSPEASAAAWPVTAARSPEASAAPCSAVEGAAARWDTGTHARLRSFMPCRVCRSSASLTVSSSEREAPSSSAAHALRRLKQARVAGPELAASCVDCECGAAVGNMADRPGGSAVCCTPLPPGTRLPAAGCRRRRPRGLPLPILDFEAGVACGLAVGESAALADAGDPRSDSKGAADCCAPPSKSLALAGDDACTSTLSTSYCDSERRRGGRTRLLLRRRGCESPGRAGDGTAAPAAWDWPTAASSAAAVAIAAAEAGAPTSDEGGPAATRACSGRDGDAAPASASAVLAAAAAEARGTLPGGTASSSTVTFGASLPCTSPGSVLATAAAGAKTVAAG